MGTRNAAFLSLVVAATAFGVPAAASGSEPATSNDPVTSNGAVSKPPVTTDGERAGSRASALVEPAATDSEGTLDLDASVAESERPEPRFSLLIGGGLSNFVGDLANESTHPGGAWEATLVFGGRQHLALEVSYNGSVNTVEAVGLSGNALLIGTTAQTAFRANLNTGDVQPYAIAGFGWTHYALAGEAVNVSGIRNDDNVLIVPVGGGLSVHMGQLVLDMRAFYRHAFSSNMFDTIADATGRSGKMSSWVARVALGFEI